MFPMEQSYREAYQEMSTRYRATCERLALLQHQHEVLSSAYNEAIARITELQEELKTHLMR